MHHGFRVDVFTLDEPVQIEGRYEVGFDWNDPTDVARLRDRQAYKRSVSKVYCSDAVDA